MTASHSQFLPYEDLHTLDLGLGVTFKHPLFILPSSNTHLHCGDISTTRYDLSEPPADATISNSFNFQGRFWARSKAGVEAFQIVDFNLLVESSQKKGSQNPKFSLEDLKRDEDVFEAFQERQSQLRKALSILQNNFLVCSAHASKPGFTGEEAQGAMEAIPTIQDIHIRTRTKRAMVIGRKQDWFEVLEPTN